jgi:hypothetical protein
MSLKDTRATIQSVLLRTILAALFQGSCLPVIVFRLRIFIWHVVKGIASTLAGVRCIFVVLGGGVDLWLDRGEENKLGAIARAAGWTLYVRSWN